MIEKFTVYSVAGYSIDEGMQDDVYEQLVSKIEVLPLRCCRRRRRQKSGTLLF